MMKRVLQIIGVLLLVALIAFAVGPGRMLYGLLFPQKVDLPIAAALVAHDTKAGKDIVSRVKSMDLSPLEQSFEAQQYASYCGVASSVTVLKALGIDTNQDDFFIDGADDIRSARDTLFGGMTLQQLGGLLRLHGVNAEAHHAGESTVEQFRQAARKNLAQSKDFVVINYLRKAIEQQTGGHISPVAAYDEITDRFLVLDVAVHKYPPVWVKTQALYDSMNTVDSDSNKTRGWVLVSAK